MVLVFSGCSTIRLVADYDEQTDVAVTQFQRTVETFLTSLERNMGKDEASYESNVKFYDEARVDLSAIRLRAAAMPDNELTIQQLDLLSGTLGNLEKLHKLGIDANDIPPVRTAFNVSCTAILKLELAKKRGKS
jgi:hypothetical protein